jgi:cytochrome c biogenesis protein
VVLLAQKRAWARLGVYVVHASVLIIFAGAIIGGIWGFSGYINIREGQTLDHVELDSGQVLPLGFRLRLDKFTLTKYPGQQIPSEYRSDVTFIKGDRQVKTYLIVNRPAHFEGIDFYQSSYGVAPTRLKLRFTRDGKSQEVELKHRQWTELPGGGQAGVMDVRQEVNMGDMYRGPIARVAYQAEGKEPVVLTAFKAGTKIPTQGPVKFEILEVKAVPYSGLQVKRDPGVWFIWVGCTLMVIGFFIAFYMSHRKVWIRLAPASSGRTRVEIAGSSNKNRAGLQRLMLRLAAKLKGEQ